MRQQSFVYQENTTADQWKFLTTEQALEDVVYFANSFSNTTNNSSQPALHPSVTPWIWLGGSYPGVRGAFMRVRNPEVIFATWASSAPVHAQVDMSSYYKAAERSLTRNCSADWVAVTKYVDDVLSGSNATASTDIKFALKFAELSGKGGNTTLAMNLTREEAANISNVNAASILMDPLDFYQVWPNEFCPSSILLLRDFISTMDSIPRSFHFVISLRHETTLLMLRKVALPQQTAYRQHFRPLPLHLPNLTTIPSPEARMMRLRIGHGCGNTAQSMVCISIRPPFLS